MAFKKNYLPSTVDYSILQGLIFGNTFHYSNTGPVSLSVKSFSNEVFVVVQYEGRPDEWKIRHDNLTSLHARFWWGNLREKTTWKIQALMGG